MGEEKTKLDDSLVGSGSEAMKPPTSTGDVKKMQKHLDFLTGITYAIMTVLFIGFAGVFVAAASMLVDSFKSKTTSYENLINRIDNLSREIQKNKSTQSNCLNPREKLDIAK